MVNGFSALHLQSLDRVDLVELYALSLVGIVYPVASFGSSALACQTRWLQRLH